MNQGIVPRLIGYARVSTEDQKLDMQLRALRDLGCSEIYTDRGQSGAVFDRPGLDEAIQNIKAGETLVVWRLDRLGRSLSGLVRLVEQLGKKKIQFRSVMENIDTNSPGGRLMFHMMAALAEFERALISERTRVGLEEARAQGKSLGRPRALTEQEIYQAHYAIHVEQSSVESVAAKFQVSTRTLHRHLRYSSST